MIENRFLEAKNVHSIFSVSFPYLNIFISIRKKNDNLKFKLFRFNIKQQYFLLLCIFVFQLYLFVHTKVTFLSHIVTLLEQRYRHFSNFSEFQNAVSQ